MESMINFCLFYILIQYQLFKSVYNFVQIPSWDWIQEQSEIKKIKQNSFQHDLARYYLLSLLISLWVKRFVSLEQLSVGVKQAKAWRIFLF